MTENDVIGADDHQTAFKVLVDALLDDVMQMFTFLLLVNHQLFLQLNL